MTIAMRRPLSFAALLRLGRVSNLPTVWTNVLAATVLAGGEWRTASAGLVVLAMSLFYVGGMYLNDYFDRAVDAQERPSRPIPAGDVAAPVVAAIGFALLSAGIVLLAAGGLAAAGIGLLLAALIVAYDAFHKGNPVSPVMMGLCRTLVYFGAAAAAVGGVPTLVVWAGLALAAYVAGLTYAARQESFDRVGNLWPLLVLALPMVLALPALGEGVAAVAIYLALIAWTSGAVYLLARRPMAGAVSRAVAVLIAGISMVDAALLASIGALAPALIAVVGCGLTIASQKYVAGT